MILTDSWHLQDVPPQKGNVDGTNFVLRISHLILGSRFLRLHRLPVFLLQHAPETAEFAGAQ